MLKTISLSEARDRFVDVLEQVKRDRAPLAIADNGVPTVVLMPVDHYESLLATLRDYGDYLDVLDAQQEAAEPLETVLADLGLDDVSGDRSA